MTAECEERLQGLEDRNDAQAQMRREPGFPPPVPPKNKDLTFGGKKGIRASMDGTEFFCTSQFKKTSLRNVGPRGVKANTTKEVSVPVAGPWLPECGAG